ncbi:MAG: hypothetical protein R6X02_18535 [Enhygromyxa sp.]
MLGRRSLLSPLALTLVLAVTLILACEDEDDEIGTPCETDEDCSGSLTCDVHDGQGTCQREHEH